MNKYQKSLHNIMLLMPGIDHTGKYNEDFRNLKEIVNRSNPKKISWYKDMEDNLLMTIYIECPCCEYSFEEDEIKREIGYCPECGQALEWSAENEQ